MDDAKAAAQKISISITDSVHARQLQALRLSEIRYRRLFEAAHDGILIVEPATHRIKDANPFVTELLGCTRAGVLGKTLGEIGLFQDERACEAMFEALQEKGVFRDDVLSSRTKAGQRQALELISNVYEEAGLKLVLCNIRDVTERKRTEEKIRVSEARMAVELVDTGELQSISGEMILEENVEALFRKILDASIAVTHSDMGSLQMFYPERGELRLLAYHGFRPEAAAFWEWVRPDSGSTCGVALRLGKRFLAADIEQCDLIVGTPDFDVYRGTGVRAVQSTPLVSRTGRVLGMISNHWRNPHQPSEHALRLLDALARQAADLIERKQAQDELRHAKTELAEQAAHLEQLVRKRTEQLAETNEQLEAFVYSIAHDLRAPLRAMRGFATMLVEEAGKALSEAGQMAAGRINHAAQFMDSLLMDLVALSQVSRRPIEIVPLQLEAVLQSALNHFKDQIKDKNAFVEAGGPWPLVLAHEPTLGRVISNLIGNALKFVPDDRPPLVRLRAEDLGEFVRLWVEDNGIGIAPGAERQIFGVFTRLHGKKYSGTGIGLAIVQKGVERMGGKAGVESTLGEGSRFWFDLRKG
jgi:PAS domain S-box-containing protein